MITHVQKWEDHKNIIIFDERSDSSVQLVIYDDDQARSP